MGNTSIVDKSAIPAIFSCKSTAFRTNVINSFYFIAYLNCRYGKKLLQRSVRGHVQTGINIDDLKSLLVFIPSQNNQEQIASTVIQAKQTLEDSKLLYQQAENLLLEKLALKDFQVEDDLSFVVNLSDVKSANRVDAEYFHPKYQKLVEQIKKHNAKLLGDLLTKDATPGVAYVVKDIWLMLMVLPAAAILFLSLITAVMVSQQVLLKEYIILQRTQLTC